MKLLIGGSPCTHWSIAQTKNRETEPEGLGWELFKNYLIALEKFKPDFFLYENNKSMAPAIRAQITRELGVEPILINSALVSAQNRQRLYWTNIPGVEQPEDLGILLRDILESGLPPKEKGYTLKANYANAGAVNGVGGQHFPAPMAAEPVNMTADGKARCLRATYYKDGIRNLVGNTVDCKTCVAEPVRIGTIESDAKNADFDSQQYQVYSPDGKSVTLCGQGGGVGAKTGLYATPVRVGDMPNAAGEISGSQSGRIYSVDGKGVPLQARPNGGGADGAATGLYAVPAGMAWRGRGDSSAYEVRDDQKANSVTAAGHQSRLVVEPAAGRIVGRRINSDGHRDDYNESIERYQRFEANENPQKTNCISTVTKDNMVAVPAEYYGMPLKMEIKAEDGKIYPVYEVRGGQITIKDKQYPIKLADGFYIIRKLTVTECKRLQTVPEEYIFPVSDTQAYKMLGNGWTVDVIAHILHYAPGITTEPLEVLSMYDGMSCGHLALNKLGAHIAHYYATEIDKYAVQTTQHNFPDTTQLGDAFQVRDDGWSLPGLTEEESVDTPTAEAVEETNQAKPDRPEKRKAAQLEIVPMTLREANAYVEQHHRHHGPVAGQKYSIGLSDGEKIVGVAIVGRPVSRHLDDGWTLEVNRLCTDGTKNACSMLYAAAWRAARAMGYKRLVTYILESENGASLRAAGWKCVGQAGGLRWTGERRPEVDLYPAQMKIRFEQTVSV